MFALVCRCGHKFMDKFSCIQNLVHNFCFISMYYWFHLNFLAVTSNCIKNICSGFDSLHNLSYQNIELRYRQKKNFFWWGLSTIKHINIVCPHINIIYPHIIHHSSTHHPSTYTPSINHASMHHPSTIVVSTKDKIVQYLLMAHNKVCHM